MEYISPEQWASVFDISMNLWQIMTTSATLKCVAHRCCAGKQRITLIYFKQNHKCVRKPRLWVHILREKGINEKLQSRLPQHYIIFNNHVIGASAYEKDMR